MPFKSDLDSYEWRHSKSVLQAIPGTFVNIRNRGYFDSGVPVGQESNKLPELNPNVKHSTSRTSVTLSRVGAIGG